MIIRAVDGLLSDGIDFCDAIENWWMFYNFWLLVVAISKIIVLLHDIKNIIGL